MIGLVNKPYHLALSERIRCFMYHRTRRGFRVAQSGDATCIGMRSIEDGERLMTLKEGKFKELNGDAKIDSKLIILIILSEPSFQFLTTEFRTQSEKNTSNGLCSICIKIVDQVPLSQKFFVQKGKSFFLFRRWSPI